MNPILERLIALFIDKKKIIGWLAAVAIAIGAAAAGMSFRDFKDAVVNGPAIEVPTTGPAK